MSDRFRPHNTLPTQSTRSVQFLSQLCIVRITFRRVDSDIEVRTPSRGCVESGDGGRVMPMSDAVHLDSGNRLHHSFRCTDPRRHRILFHVVERWTAQSKVLHHGQLISRWFHWMRRYGSISSACGHCRHRRWSHCYLQCLLYHFPPRICCQFLYHHWSCHCHCCLFHHWSVDPVVCHLRFRRSLGHS